MAYISIPADSDGDLHDANMHNNKFNTIADKINGNIDHDNLAFPRSDFIMSFSSNHNTVDWREVSTLTSSLVIGNTGSISVNALNVMQSSWVRIPMAVTVSDAHMVFTKVGAIYTSGNNFNIYLQGATTLLGTYNINIASQTNVDFDTGATFEIGEQALGLGSATLAANTYIRLLIQSPAAAANLPPQIELTVRARALHVA